MRSPLTLVAVAWMMPACTATIAGQNPHPNIALSPQQKSLRLVFGKGIDDPLSLPIGVNTVVVEDWRATLSAGFQNGFGTSYRLVGTDDADLALTLDEVRVELGNFEPARARIQFKATLTGDGATLRRSAGMVVKAGPAFIGGGAIYSTLLGADIGGAVEAMYEQIARDLLGTVEVATPRTPLMCIPGQSSGCIGPHGCQGFQVCTDDGSRFAACSCGD